MPALSSTLQELSGLLPIHKPRGMISKDVSRVLERRFGKLKLGHVGTLDPGASGVLPILVGSATRLQDYLLEMSKEYHCTIALGYETDTLDADGRIQKVTPVPDSLTRDQVESVARQFVGQIRQVPPLYSAVKVAGRALYDYARGGDSAEINLEDLARRVVVQSLTITAFDVATRTIDFHTQCSKGTYVRCLARDLAYALGTCATVTSIVRERAAGIPLTATMSLDDVNLEEQLVQATVPVAKIDLGWPKWQVPDERAMKILLSGQGVSIHQRDMLASQAVEIAALADAGVSEHGNQPHVLLVDPCGNGFAIGSARKNGDKLIVTMRRRLT